MKTLFTFLLLLLCSTGFAQKKRAEKVDKNEYQYELETYNNAAATPGYLMVKVWSYGRRKILTNNHCMQNAIHGILFKGCAEQGVNAGCAALVPEGYEAHNDFFDRFFKGKYLQYVQLTNRGMIDAGDVIKLKGNKYRIGMVMMINLNALRKYLESENIIKPLDFLFK